MFRRKKALLKRVEYNDVVFFNLNGYKTWAKCVKLYDGDTATFAFYFHKKIYKFRTRLAGIDTAELRSENPEEVRAANLARDRLKELIGKKLVYIECLHYGKYGRILCNIYDDKTMTKSYNNILLEEGLAYMYSGSKKVDFEDWYKKKTDS